MAPPRTPGSPSIVDVFEEAPTTHPGGGRAELVALKRVLDPPAAATVGDDFDEPTVEHVLPQASPDEPTQPQRPPVAD